MDTVRKEKGIRGKKTSSLYWGGAVILLLLAGLFSGNHASTLKVDGKSWNIADVTYGKFNDYIRANGQVAQPISVVQLSPEEGGIVQGKVVEEGSPREERRRDSSSSNSNLDLQILNSRSLNWRKTEPAPGY